MMDLIEELEKKLRVTHQTKEWLSTFPSSMQEYGMYI